MNENKLEVERCTKCVTPADYPGAALDAERICFYCREYKKIWGSWEDQNVQGNRRFEKILAKARKKSLYYDVLVPLSGGKDSTYALYLATKVYKLKTLSYTFDNGFMTEVAKENIKRAVEVSGADHYMFTINPQRLMRLYKHFFKHTGLFCPVCMRAMALGRIALHRQYKIPLILRGTSKRTEEWVTPEIFQDGRLSFFDNVLRKFPVDFEVGDLYLDRNIYEKFCFAVYLLSRARIAIGVMDIQLPDYLEWNYDNIYETITKEFGWRKLPDRDEHIDCMVEPVVHYVRRQKVSDLTPNTLRYSSMVRTGMMDRDQALRLVNEEKDEAKAPPKQVQYLLEKLNVSQDEFDEWSQFSLRHMEFQKTGLAMRLFQLCRKFISRDSSRM